jgi:hypothetical protein
MLFEGVVVGLRPRLGRRESLSTDVEIGGKEERERENFPLS